MIKMTFFYWLFSCGTASVAGKHNFAARFRKGRRRRFSSNWKPEKRSMHTKKNALLASRAKIGLRRKIMSSKKKRIHALRHSQNEWVIARWIQFDWKLYRTKKVVTNVNYIYVLLLFDIRVLFLSFFSSLWAYLFHWITLALRYATWSNAIETVWMCFLDCINSQLYIALHSANTYTILHYTYYYALKLFNFCCFFCYTVCLLYIRLCVWFRFRFRCLTISIFLLMWLRRRFFLLLHQ